MSAAQPVSIALSLSGTPIAALAVLCVTIGGCALTSVISPGSLHPLLTDAVLNAIVPGVF